MQTNQPKIVVLDDDPTGSQTVHSCLLLMGWDVATLRLALADEVPIFFILTNTRAVTAAKAAEITTEVCKNLKRAFVAEEIVDFLIVSRSDSTLRGHYPIETDVIERELGSFDAHFLTPAFFEGGRVTLESIHYLSIDGVRTPVSETEFARDSVFGYSHSYLPDYVAEKTQGKIPAAAVTRFTLADLRQGVRSRLLNLVDNQCVVVDGETQADFDLFAKDILSTVAIDKRFFFRSAASLITSLAQLGSQPILPEEMAKYKPTQQPGVFIIGSHVRKTTQQLASLLSEKGIAAIEVDVARLRDFSAPKNQLLVEILQAVQQAFDQGQTPVVYTSRQELSFANIQQRLDFGIIVSDFLMNIVKGLPPEIGFLVSKGGITSNDVLSKGLNLATARLLGQIIPGCSIVRTPTDHPHFPNLPVVLFPGNVGEQHSLVSVWNCLRKS